MEVQVIAEARRETYPGHLVIGQVTPDKETSYYGYRFDPDDLPDEVSDPSAWYGYLTAHTVPGNIVPETRYVELLQASREAEREYVTVRSEVETSLDAVMPPESKWRGYARYAFKPDDLTTAAAPCYNCVTWSHHVMNPIAPGLIPRVHNGRLSETIEQLRNSQAVKGS